MISLRQLAAALAPPDDEDSFVLSARRRVLAYTFALVLAAAAFLSYQSGALIDAELAPEVLEKSAVMADFIATDVELAIGYGVPLDRLAGVGSYLDESRAGHPEIKFIALLAVDGHPLYVSGDYPTGSRRAAAEEAARPVIAGTIAAADATDLSRLDIAMRVVRTQAGPVAGVAIGNDPGFLQRQMADLAFDIVIVLLVSLFLTFEIAVALIAVRAVKPMNQLLTLMRAGAAGDLRRIIAHHVNNDVGRAIQQFNRIVTSLNDHYGRLLANLAADTRPDLRSRLFQIGERFGLSANGAVPTPAAAAAVDVRLPLFVFILAEEMQKPFLPLYVKSLGGSFARLPQEVLIGLPISVYMLVLALATPFAASWVDRLGARRIFVLGLVPAIGGFLGAAFATTVGELIAARSLTAIGYAMCTIAAQGFIIEVTSVDRRAQGISVFVGVLMTANICGTAIGGILADRIGYRAVFLCAASLALLAGVLGRRMLPAAAATAPRADRPRLADLLAVLAGWRFAGLVVFAAIPAKIVLTGFLFYAVPLYLGQIGVPEAGIGRIMMTYSLVIALAGPWLSIFSDRYRAGRWMVFGGTLLSGLAMAIPSLRPDRFGVFAAVVAVALAHAASISPQIALLPAICQEEIRRVGETAVLGVLRMAERVGSVIGPILVAAWVTRFGFVEGLALVGVAVCLLSFLLLTSLIGLPQSAEVENALP
jgi:predicted MFS family arabinose efflux permease/HAMP domain-containing protein